jgi:ribosome maturation factor RimP
VSRSLSTLIDVGDIIPEHYTLEISSPGIERQLNKLQDYQRFTGNDALVELRVPINNKKKIRCNIRGVREDDNIEIFCLDEINSDKNLINVSFQNIERAKLLAPYS